MRQVKKIAAKKMDRNEILKAKAYFFTILLFLAPGVAGAASFTLDASPPGAKHKHESEHRPVPERTYWLGANVSPNARAYYVRADGATQEISVRADNGAPFVTVNTQMGEGPAHGANNVYVFDKEVVGNTLLYRTAKRTVIQHSCGWGHEHKYDEGRMTPGSLDLAPLEIVCEDMWNGNFHVETQSGSNIDCRILSYGKPAAGAKVEVATRRGWVKTLRANDAGEVNFQIIRDYYPDKWTGFNRRNVSGFLMTAEYDVEESGELSGASYDKVKMISTLPWRYSPSRQDYTSYSHGLAIAAIFLIVPSILVYVYRERRKRPFREVVFDEKA